MTLAMKAGVVRKVLCHVVQMVVVGVQDVYEVFAALCLL